MRGVTLAATAVNHGPTAIAFGRRWLGRRHRTHLQRFSFTADRDIGAGAAQQVGGAFAQNGEAFRALVFAIAGTVLIEADVDGPIGAVSDVPMGAHRVGETLRGKEKA